MVNLQVILPLPSRTLKRMLPKRFHPSKFCMHFLCSVFHSPKHINSNIAVNINYCSQRGHFVTRWLCTCAGVLSHYTNYLMSHFTPWTRVLHQKLISTLLVNNFPVFYAIRRFSTVFTGVCPQFHESNNQIMNLNNLTSYDTSLSLKTIFSVQIELLKCQACR
jgi:hypothetical protein